MLNVTSHKKGRRHNRERVALARRSKGDSKGKKSEWLWKHLKGIEAGHGVASRFDELIIFLDFAEFYGSLSLLYRDNGISTLFCEFSE